MKTQYVRDQASEERAEAKKDALMQGLGWHDCPLVGSSDSQPINDTTTRIHLPARMNQQSDAKRSHESNHTMMRAIFDQIPQVRRLTLICLSPVAMAGCNGAQSTKGNEFADRVPICSKCRRWRRTAPFSFEPTKIASSKLEEEHQTFHSIGEFIRWDQL
jgi:hypothetical protein